MAELRGHDCFFNFADRSHHGFVNTSSNKKVFMFFIHQTLYTFEIDMVINVPNNVGLETL